MMIRHFGALAVFTALGACASPQPVAPPANAPPARVLGGPATAPAATSGVMTTPTPSLAQAPTTTAAPMQASPGFSSGAPVVAPQSGPLLQQATPQTPSEATQDAPVVVLKARTGTFGCELGRQVLIKEVAADNNSMVVNWLKKDITLRGGHTASGALRYEDARTGLAWIIIVGKAMLLDTRKGQQLANECKPLS